MCVWCFSDAWPITVIFRLTLNLVLCAIKKPQIQTVSAKFLMMENYIQKVLSWGHFQPRRVNNICLINNITLGLWTLTLDNILKRNNTEYYFKEIIRHSLCIFLYFASSGQRITALWNRYNWLCICVTCHLHEIWYTYAARCSRILKISFFGYNNIFNQFWWCSISKCACRKLMQFPQIYVFQI